MARKGKEAAADASAGQTGAVVAVVREWEPQHPDSLTKIHAEIDSWGRRPDQPEPRDWAEIESAVDRLTKRVKSRKVTVHETVTDYVDAEDELAEVVTPPSTFTEVTPVEEPRPARKRKGKMLGWFGPKSAKKRVDDAVALRAERNSQAASSDYQPQCMALTEDGQQCLNSARGESKYCSSHRGYQPPTAKGIAQRVEGEAWDPSDNVTDQSAVRAARTKPKVRKAKDTTLAVRKSSKKGGRKKR